MSAGVATSYAQRGASTTLLGATLLLLVLGSIMVYSTTAPLTLGDFIPPHLARHSLGLILGVAAAWMLSHIPHRVLRYAAPALFVATLAALAVVPFVGIRVNGAQRWLSLPGVGVFQPGELAKFATVLWVAVLASYRGGSASTKRSREDATPRITRQNVILCLAAGALPAGLLVLQPDFGNAALLLMLVLLLLFTAGTPLRWLALPSTVGTALGALFVLLHPYALRRWVGFMDPWAAPSNEGFQLVQSFVAFARGGPLGVGLGYGRQKLHYLPEAHTDFVLSVIAEELGLAGVALVLIAFAVLFGAGLRIALKANTRFASLLAFGMTLLVVVPALVNAAVVMGVLPTKGLSLPFLSYGRSSLIVSCAAIGIVWGVARANSNTGGRRAGASSSS